MNDLRIRIEIMCADGGEGDKTIKHTATHNRIQSRHHDTFMISAKNISAANPDFRRPFELIKVF